MTVAVMMSADRDVLLADAGLPEFINIDYLAAKSNVGRFAWTVALALSHTSHTTQ